MNVDARRNGFQAVLQITSDGYRAGFHQGWCNSPCCVNETLQKPEIVLVSDPFTKFRSTA